MVSSSDTLLFRHRRSSGAHRQDQIYLCEQLLCWLFDLSFCLARPLLPLCLPYPCFSVLQLYSTTSNGMAYLIRYAWADSLIEAASLSISLVLLFFFICDSSAAPQRPVHRLLSPHLASSSVPPLSAAVQHCPLRWVGVLHSHFFLWLSNWIVSIDYFIPVNS